MILVGIPFHDAKRYSIEPLLDWLKSADLPDCEVLMRFHRGVYGEKDAVKKQREFFRTEALRQGATHLLFVGADTIPPINVLEQFLAHNVDVVGGIYYGRTQADNGNPFTAVAWKHNQGQAFNSRENLSKLKGLVEVDGMGMDCVLFSQKALESCCFMDYEVNDDDYPIYDRLKRAGFEIYLDADVTCKHYSDKEKFN